MTNNTQHTTHNTQHTTKAKLTALLLCTSFSIYAANGNDDEKGISNTNTVVSNTNLTETSNAEAKSQGQHKLMTKEHFVNSFSENISPTIGVDRDHIRPIIDAIPDTQWPSFVHMCHTLQLINQNPFPSLAVEAIARNVPADKWRVFTDLASKITPYVHKVEGTIGILARTEPTKWQEFLNTFLYIKDGIDLFDRQNFISGLLKLPADKYPAVQKYCKIIKFREGYQGDVHERRGETDSYLVLALIEENTLTALERIPSTQLHNFFNTIKAIAYKRDPLYIQYSIKGLVNIPDEYWPNFVSISQTIEQTHTEMLSYHIHNAQDLMLKINPILWPALQQFMRNHHNFLTHMTEGRFIESMQVSTPEALKEVLKRFRDEFYPDAPQSEIDE